MYNQILMVPFQDPITLYWIRTSVPNRNREGSGNYVVRRTCQAKYHNPDSNQGLEIIGTFSGPSHPDIQGLAVLM